MSGIIPKSENICAVYEYFLASSCFSSSPPFSLSVQFMLFSFHSVLLRDRITLVPQKPYLFEGTIKDNILIGNPNATDDDGK